MLKSDANVLNLWSYIQNQQTQLNSRISCYLASPTHMWRSCSQLEQCYDRLLLNHCPVIWRQRHSRDPDRTDVFNSRENQRTCTERTCHSWNWDRTHWTIFAPHLDIRNLGLQVPTTKPGMNQSTGETKSDFVHSASVNRHILLFGVARVLEPMTAVSRGKAVIHPWQSIIEHLPPSNTPWHRGSLESPVNIMWMSLDFGRKPECMKKTQTGSTNSTQDPQARVKSGTFLQRGAGRLENLSWHELILIYCQEYLDMIVKWCLTNAGCECITPHLKVPSQNTSISFPHIQFCGKKNTK